VSEERDYLLGSDDAELERLAAQHRVYRERALALWRRAGFGQGQTLLDLGCGPGFTTIDLAELVGAGGRVLAVDRSTRFLEHLRRQAEARGLDNVELREADAATLELDAGSLDGAYSRWLLCFLARPRECVERVARALRPGAAFATTDYFNYRAFTVAPRSPVVDRVVAAVQRAWAADGGNLDVQGEVPSMMAAAGLRVDDVRSITGIERPGSPGWRWPRSFFPAFLETMVRMELITADDAEAFEGIWDERERQPGSFVHLPPVLDVIGVKPA